jgi:hypothetical protein
VLILIFEYLYENTSKIINGDIHTGVEVNGMQLGEWTVMNLESANVMYKYNYSEIMYDWKRI